MAEKKPPLSIAEILDAARKADANDAVTAMRQAASDRLEHDVRYAGPRYCGKTIEEWMDLADAGRASIHDIRKAFYRVTPKAKGSVPALIRWLSHRHAHYRFAAARTLGLIGPDAEIAIDELVKLIDDTDSSVRDQALESLLKVGIPQAAISKISRCLSDPDMVVQRSALDCLANVGSKAVGAIPQVIKALGNDQLVAHAANALAAIGPLAAAAVPDLARVLATHEFHVYRCAAATALGRIGTREAIVCVERGLEDRHKAVRAAARAAP